MPAFDLPSFYADVQASAKEKHALRQDLVRGLKDYYEGMYGFDRFGAETIFHLPERMGEPRIFGYAALRVLHDRRLSVEVKRRVAERSMQIMDYESDAGLPFGLFAMLHFLAEHDWLSTRDLRYALVVSAGEHEPFRGLERSDLVRFFRWILGNATLHLSERVFWGHSLIARHRDQVGASELINALLGMDAIASEVRGDLCRAWINHRQPHLEVNGYPLDGMEPSDDPRSCFVADHLPFWVAHAPSWPTNKMVHYGVFWLARLGSDPLAVAETYIAYHGPYAEQVHSAVVSILAEHHTHLADSDVRRVIDQGLILAGSTPIRRRFYRLGTDLFGAEYLSRASTDSANSVRQWAVKQTDK